MYTAIEGRWLLHVGDSRVELADMVGSKTFSTSEPLPTEFLRAVSGVNNEDSKLSEELHCEAADEIAFLVLVRSTINGLEMKPLKFVLQSDDSLSIPSLITSLVNDFQRTSKQLQETSERLGKVEQMNHDMIEDKEEMQDIMLQRVYAILKERNVWIEKFKNNSKD